MLSSAWLRFIAASNVETGSRRVPSDVVVAPVVPEAKEPTLREMIISKTYPGAPSDIRLTVFPVKSTVNIGKYTLFDVNANATFGTAKATFQKAVEAANRENIRIGQPIPPTKPAIKRVKKLLTPQQIADFDVSSDKVVRRGEKTFVIDTTGQRADIEVASDIITPEFEANITRLTHDQRAKMFGLIRSTPYLSDEGRIERLGLIKLIERELIADEEYCKAHNC